MRCRICRQLTGFASTDPSGAVIELATRTEPDPYDRRMPAVPPGTGLTDAALATDSGRLTKHFGRSADLLPLWIAEPYVELAPEVGRVLRSRADRGWYGYETRPPDVIEAFWTWARDRHGWDGSDLLTSVSPSVGTSIGVLIDRFSSPGDGVILQPPVFTDFKPLIRSAGREVVRNSLTLTASGYRMDLDDLERTAADPATKIMILCNPHNPVGRVWSAEELGQVAAICARGGVLVIADEIHADLALPPNRFVPFAMAARGSDVAWAAAHGPIKTFGVAGVCDTLLICADEQIATQFRSVGSRLHLTRNNVFSIAAFEAGYRSGGPWLDRLLELVAANSRLLQEGLPDGIDLVTPEGTYLAWLDLRALEMGVPDLAEWLTSSARLALSPGHWFGREGAGFARMTIAAPTARIEEAIARLARAVGGEDTGRRVPGA
jgi:cystathionine beta-lyase